MAWIAISFPLLKMSVKRAISFSSHAIRGLLQKFLSIWGYRTLVASDGEEALEVAADHPGKIDLLLSDVTMPKVDGQELAEKLTKTRPSIKVILMSGFSHAQVVVKKGWRFVQKPFKPSDIKETIKGSLIVRTEPHHVDAMPGGAPADCSS